MSMKGRWKYSITALGDLLATLAFRSMTKHLHIFVADLASGNLFQDVCMSVLSFQTLSWKLFHLIGRAICHILYMKVYIKLPHFQAHQAPLSKSEQSIFICLSSVALS